MKLIAKALIEAQKEMGNAVKDSKNPYFKSSYATLNSVMEACIPILNKHQIAVLQPITQVGDKSYVNTLLIHESGEMINGLTEIVYAKVGDAQAQGSGITYARRYGLQSLVCIGAEDDDGNKASEQSKTPLQKVADGIDESEAQTHFDWLSEAIQACETLAELAHLKTTKEFKQSYAKLGKLDKKSYDAIGMVGTTKKMNLEKKNDGFDDSMDDNLDDIGR